jgi:hypothetical protein
MKLLTEIAKNHKTDKGEEGHIYTDVYDDYLLPRRNEAMNFFEIGIFDGESMRMWREYLPNANIIGLDINPESKKHDGERNKVYIGSQTDEMVLWKIFNENKPISVIIDDGSHQWNHIIQTFDLAFPLLAPGGLYFIEDLHTSYAGAPWAVGSETAVNYLKSLVDDVNIRGKSFMGLKELEGKPLAYNEHYIEWVHFYKSLCVIKKRQSPL